MRLCAVNHPLWRHYCLFPLQKNRLLVRASCVVAHTVPWMRHGLCHGLYYMCRVEAEGRVVRRYTIVPPHHAVAQWCNGVHL